MSDHTSSRLKAKKLGVLIRDARQVSRKSLEECAQAIGATPDTFETYEMGQQAPSLPELEALAYYLRIPVDHFLSDDGLLPQTGPDTPELQRLLPLRQKIIGVLLRQARQEKGFTPGELADRTGISVEQLQTYELGQNPVPVTELSHLALELDWQMRAFQDSAGPVGSWINQQRDLQSFMELDTALKDFICKPVNRPYLEVARRLSEMSADKLRMIAETLLEITL
jgi:transcriptional regulator with XRE-family HTH domain